MSVATFVRRTAPVIAVLMVLPCASGATDAAWAGESRTIAASWDFGGFEFTSTRNSTQGDDAIVWSFDLRDAVFTIDARLRAPVTATWHVAMAFQGLIEFQDVDQDGRYGLGDPVVQNVRFADMRASNLRVEQTGADRYVATAHYDHPGRFRGGVDLAFTITGSRLADEGPAIDPTRVRLTTTVLDFPFQSDNGTRLALHTRWDGAIGLQQGALAGAQGRSVFEAAWAEEATADGADAPVGVTVQRYDAPGGIEQVLMLSMPRADALSHTSLIGFEMTVKEPDLPTQILREVAGRWYLYFGGVALATILVLGPIIMKRREAH